MSDHITSTSLRFFSDEAEQQLEECENRLASAIARSMQSKGLTAEEATRRHFESMQSEWPTLFAAMATRRFEQEEK